ncbi:LysM peptidoglycan-binding domain-containing protein [Oceanibium sediminis]|uniref:LysM peptidoglycan-binding domain-containing protein n=1 Tax=Oceanibium sediminis TaxID=2026339 RepID=UPI000DD48A19|nr:transporter substrate-binding domain-containing protein [Oceanibium sediminis]
MTKKIFLAVSCALGLSAGTAMAQDIECGTSYTVKRGDTLSRIASRAYGSAASYQLIYSANSRAIGPNPGIIEIGALFQIPCLDAPLTPSTANNETIRDEPTTALVPVEDRQIRFVTATNWAPFINQDQEQGGMITEIVNVAMSKVAEPDDYKIDWVNDWSAHLRPLLADVAYDFSLAWFRPNCDVIEKLGEGSQYRCNNLDWSEPLYEQIIGIYTRNDYPAPLSHADLFGANVCRPAGYSMFMMEEHDLVQPNITLSQPAGPGDCFEGLRDGTYDAVVLAVDVAEGAISDIGATGAFAKHDALDTIATLHAVTSKNNPNGAAQLALLDDGINRIKDSGEWFSIVRRHLAEHQMKRQ